MGQLMNCQAYLQKYVYIFSLHISARLIGTVTLGPHAVTKARPEGPERTPETHA